MSDTVETSEKPQVKGTPPGLAMLLTLGMVSAISGFLVVSAYQLSLPRIEENKRQAIESALYQVVPGAVARRDFVASADGIHPVEEGVEGTAVYAGYDASGKLKGVALEAAGPGYQDVIRMLYGYDPYCECIRGIKVLRMAETPGIGDRVARDKDFLENFNSLTARVNPAGNALENEIVTVKHGTKNQPWQIDAISGATISSTAIGRMLNRSAQQVIPIIQRHLRVLEDGYRMTNAVSAHPASEGE